MTFLDVAVAGTARAPAGAAATGTPVDQLVPQEATGEQAVLLRAGALAAYRLAGGQSSAARGPDPCPADTAPVAPPGAARFVTELMHYGDAELLRECFDRLARTGFRLSPGLLPAVLDLDEPAVRTSAAALLGERGRWLARFRTEWSWVRDLGPPPPADAERDWNEGSLEARRAALRSVRATDPARARAWLESAWNQEKAELRAEFLEALQVGLGREDEPFLEPILDDRSQTVRVLAAELLARIPESALLRRVTERADSILTYSPPVPGLVARLKFKVGGGPPVGTLTAAPPGKLDPSWLRDGVPEKAPKGIGQRAHWVASVVALVPPAHWTQRFAATPAALVRAAWAGEWGFAVAHGWSRAALTHGAREWMPALWDGWLAAKTQGAELAVQSEMLRALLESADPADLEARALDLLRDPPDPRVLDPSFPIAVCPAPWSEQLGTVYLDTVERQLSASKVDPTFFARTGTHAALALPPSLFGRAAALRERGKPGVMSPWTMSLQEFTGVVQLRRRMHEEIPA